MVSKEKEFLSTFTESIENVALIEQKNFSDSYSDFVINSKSNGNVSCDSCSKVFETTNAYKVHKYQVHCDDASRTCKFCGILFSCRRSLVKHMKSIHNSKNKKILSFENNNSSFFMIHTDAKEDEHPKKFFNLIKNKENTANEISACCSTILSQTGQTGLIS